MINQQVLEKIKEILLDHPTAKASVLACSYDDKPLGLYLRIRLFGDITGMFFQGKTSLMETTFAVEKMLTDMDREADIHHFPHPYFC